jgi:hypothetical protein
MKAAGNNQEDRTTIYRVCIHEEPTVHGSSCGFSFSISNDTAKMTKTLKLFVNSMHMKVLQEQVLTVLSCQLQLPKSVT